MNAVETTQEDAVQNQELVPKQILKLAQRLARLERGRSYAITLWIPESGPPMWTINNGKIENA